VSEVYVAANEWEGAWTQVAGLSLPALSGADASAGPSGQSEARVFSEAAVGLVRRACRDAGLSFLFRGVAGEGGYRSSLLFARQTRRPGRDDAVGEVVSAGVDLLKRWQAAPLDRTALQQTLALEPSWEAVRLTKPAEPLRTPHQAVPALVEVNTNTGAWYPLISQDRFLFDVALFPSAAAEARREVHKTAAASEVVARHVEDVVLKKALEDNTASARTALGQGVFAGSAMTLACTRAEALASEVRAFRHPARGEIAGWVHRPEDIPADRLAWELLDYGEAGEDLTAVEPDVRRVLEWAVSLGFHWGDWRRARRLMDPVDYLLGRLEMFEQRLAQQLQEIREALKLAKVLPHSAVVEARRVTEAIVQRHYLKHYPNKAKNIPPLNNMIEQLQGKVPGPIISLMHTLRTFGNVGAHAVDYPITEQNLGVVVESLCLLMEWNLNSEPQGGAPA